MRFVKGLANYIKITLIETLANGSPGPLGSFGNVANYMGQMAMAVGKLGTLEGFLRQVIFYYGLIPLIVFPLWFMHSLLGRKDDEIKLNLETS